MASSMFAGCVDVLPRLFEAGALVAIGANLRSSGVFRDSDGQTAIRLATYLTLPSVILRATCTQGPIPSEAWLGMAVAGVCYVTQAASNWLHCMNKPKRERAVITGSGTGLALALVGYPVGEAVLGLKGLQPLVLLDVLNSVAVLVASYMLTATAGPAFPDAFKHEDGGNYRGQWRGMRKEGLGVYTYASGARYEGEWRDNLKDGRGVYFFPKGGTYEGEWAGGTMNGVGVRTFSSGQVKAGRWRDGVLEAPLELWQCASAAEGAAEAALAARNVEVGGGKLTDAAQQLLQYPPLWAAVLGISLNLLNIGLPAALDSVSAALAPANRPLMLLAVGMTLRISVPQPRMLYDVARLAATRLMVPLFVCGSLLLTCSGPRDKLFASTLAAVMLGFLSPVHPEALKYAQRFRLNADLSAAIAAASNAVAAPLLALFALAAGASGLAAPGITSAGPATATAAAAAAGAAAVGAPAAAGEALSAAATAAGMPSALAASLYNAQPLVLFSLLAVAGLGAGLSWANKNYGEEQQVLMVYAGTPGAAAMAAATAAAGAGGGGAAAAAQAARAPPPPGQQQQQPRRPEGGKEQPPPAAPGASTSSGGSNPKGKPQALFSKAGTPGVSGAASSCAGQGLQGMGAPTEHMGIPMRRGPFGPVGLPALRRAAFGRALPALGLRSAARVAAGVSAGAGQSRVSQSARLLQ